MNHFSYLLTIVKVNIFEEPQNIFSQPKSQTPNYRASPCIFNYRVAPLGMRSFLFWGSGVLGFWGSGVQVQRFVKVFRYMCMSGASIEGT